MLSVDMLSSSMLKSRVVLEEKAAYNRRSLGVANLPSINICLQTGTSIRCGNSLGFSTVPNLALLVTRLLTLVAAVHKLRRNDSKGSIHDGTTSDSCSSLTCVGMVHMKWSTKVLAEAVSGQADAVTFNG